MMCRMVERKRFWMMILAYCLIGIATFVSMNGPKTIASDLRATLTLSHNPYSPFIERDYAVQNHHGDWVVTGSENVENTTIVLDGDLIIEPNGSLTLTNVTLLMEQKPQDMYQILAKPTSTLVISNSIIAPSQRDYRFAFIVQGAHFELKQSELEGLGRPSGYNPGGGLLIQDTNATILEDNIINHHESYGITLSNSTNATIRNNTITCTGPDGTTGAIFLEYSHNNTITHNRLYRQWDALHIQQSWNNYIADNELTLTDHTLGISVWYGSGNNVITHNRISVYPGYEGMV
jgi:parallel beta-helix repeat protein